MKKIIVGIVAVLYMGVSSGFAMDIHYCMGKKAGADFYSIKKEACGKCGMKEKKGCCHDDHQFHKLNDSHQIVSNDFHFETAFIIVARLFFSLNESIAAGTDQLSLKNHSPPQYTGPSVRLLQSLFRI